MKILIGADLVPTSTNEHLFKNGDIETLFGKDLIKLISEADYRIFNLEVPLCGSERMPINKTGPRLIASPFNYSHFADEMLDTYINIFSTFQTTFIFRVANKLFMHKLIKKYLKHAYSRQRLLEMMNAIRCEAHCELLLKGISNREGKSNE